MLLNVSLTGDRELIAKLDGLPQAVHDALLQKVTELSLMLEEKVKGKLSDDVLHVRTGNLRRSIFSEVDDQGSAIFGKVASSGDVPYAAIHEFGGKTPAHDILPSKAQALAFVMEGKTVLAKIVRHPGSNIPERSYLRSSLGDMQETIIEGLTQAVQEGLSK